MALVAIFMASCFYDGDGNRNRRDDAGRSAAECHSGGQRYEFGQAFATPDGCNVCVCGARGEITCTQIQCESADAETEGPTDAQVDEPDGETEEMDAGVEEMDAGSEQTDAGLSEAGAEGCLAGGRFYALNERYLAADGCSVCRCYAPGYASCDGKWCLADLDASTPDAAEDAGGDGCIQAGKCVYNDTSLSWGETIDTGHECGFCECTTSHYLACYSQACTDAPDAGLGEGCWSGRKFYAVGQQFYMGDHCMRATCYAPGSLSYNGQACVTVMFLDRGPLNACDPGPTCTYGGKRFGAGSIIYPDGACETCTCRPDGTFNCSTDCADDAGLE